MIISKAGIVAKRALWQSEHCGNAGMVTMRALAPVGGHN